LTWGLIITGITIATIVTESVTVAKAMAITGAIPFTFIIIMQLAAFFRVVREDPMVREKHTEVRAVSSDNAASSAAQEI
jgi:glycine betaine transporter